MITLSPSFAITFSHVCRSLVLTPLFDLVTSFQSIGVSLPALSNYSIKIIIKIRYKSCFSIELLLPKRYVIPLEFFLKILKIVEY
jgi:hypothetical protein